MFLVYLNERDCLTSYFKYIRYINLNATKINKLYISGNVWKSRRYSAKKLHYLLQLFSPCKILFFNYQWAKNIKLALTKAKN